MPEKSFRKTATIIISACVLMGAGTARSAGLSRSAAVSAPAVNTPGAVSHTSANVSATATSIAPAHSSAAGKPMSVGLVLSGGGAKGIAHIGAIRALEDAGIPIDFVTGTSMGAIVGGLYACGYTTEEMMDLLLSKGFSYWSTGKYDPALMYYFARQEPTPALINVPVAKSKTKTAADSVPASLINALPMNFAFMDLFSAYTAQCGGDFNKLFVPFRCVASDPAANHKVVHRSGSVGDAIRTSMTFPLVFRPLKIDGTWLYDGGLYDNFPVDVMISDFAPDFILGFNVSSGSQGPQTSLMDQISNIAERPQSYDVPDSLGMKINIKLNQFGLLDFPAAKKIYEIGYNTTMANIDSIKSRITSRVPAVARNTARGVFKSRTPYVRFEHNVDISGGSTEQREYLKYLFEPAHADTFGIAHARESFYRTVSTGRMQELLPKAQYNDSTGLFRLSVESAAKNNYNLGIGGYISSSTSSYLFLSAGYNTLSFSSVNAAINAWIGQSYMAGYLNSSMNLRTGIPSAIGITAVASRQRYFETDKLFFEDNRPTFIVGKEYFGRLRYDIAAGAVGKVSIAAGYGYLKDQFYRMDQNVMGDKAYRDHTSYSLGQVRLAYTSSTLNDENYPTAGHDYNLVAMGVAGKYRFNPAYQPEVPEAEQPEDSEKKPKWMQLQLRTRNYWDLAKHFAFGLESDFLLSTRKLTGNYNADIVNAPGFNPTPASYNVFNRQFRANSYLSATVVPIYKYSSSLTARASLSAFLPMRRILPDTDGNSRWGGWLNSPRFFGELDISYSLPIPAVVSAWLNYASSGVRPWSCGLSLGIFLHAPHFLR